MDASGFSYKGENSLKESVIAWLEDPIHNQFMNALLQKPKWMSSFSQSSSDEIINMLRKSSDVSSLMDSIFSLATEEGITALDLSADSLRNWIIDIIDKNNIKLVFIWDEFSDYFRQNSTSLGEFQKIAAICQEKPFYFVIRYLPLLRSTTVVTKPTRGLLCSSALTRWKSLCQIISLLTLSAMRSV